ncbi:MAG: aminoglycoside phosphotransferase [Hydrocarboniphaga sp.]|uniref:phosphotransferase family protein n=1 Tax=Hydrocarboniphaga sp. TaxID=2033016 RepID=UPI002618C7B3|nr:phosphotransferase family protein [Hydrocarboniphaga sp.]MDB5967737.1 aminoglycoside phosphotransferase [Hydrocarboniphaga sp.]
MTEPITNLPHKLPAGIHAGPPPRQDDSDGFRKRLLWWFRQRLPQTDIQIAHLEVPKSNGYSNETTFVDLAIAGTTERYVLRRAPLRDPIFLGFDLSIERRTMQALAKASTAPVAEVRWFEEDVSILGASFFVMRHVDGRVPSDNPPYSAAGSGWIADATARQREQLWWNGLQTLSAVHRVDWKATGLQTPNASGAGPLSRDLEAFDALYRRGCAGHYRAILDEAHEFLSDRLPVEPEVRLCWGDARLGNLMFRDWTCVAVLDWEMSSIGMPEKDLAWWLLMDRYFHEGIGIPRMAGWPTHEETLRQYAAWVGRPLKDLPYYTVFAAYRSLVIYARFVALGLMPTVPSDLQPSARLLRRALDDAR